MVDGERSRRRCDERQLDGPWHDLRGCRHQSTAVGKASSAQADFSTAVGTGSLTQGKFASAFGNQSQAKTENSTAPGAYSSAWSGPNTTAIGHSSEAKGANATAIGQETAAMGDNSTALGQGAQATHANSAAIGQGVKTTRDNQVAIGQSTSTYTLGGISSAASRAAQGGPVNFVTSDAAGNLATRSAADMGLATTGDINALNSQIGGLQKRDNEIGRRHRHRAGSVDGRPSRATRRSRLASAGATSTAPTAMGLSLAGVLDRGGFGKGTSVVVDGGIGYGSAEGTVAGKGGITFGF